MPVKPSNKRTSFHNWAESGSKDSRCVAAEFGGQARTKENATGEFHGDSSSVIESEQLQVSAMGGNSLRMLRLYASGSRSKSGRCLGSTRTFGTIPGEDASSHGMAKNALEKPAGQKDVNYGQAPSQDQRGYRHSATGDDRSQPFEHVRDGQQLPDKLHPVRQDRDWVKDSGKRRHDRRDRPHQPFRRRPQPEHPGAGADAQRNAE